MNCDKDRSGRISQEFPNELSIVWGPVNETPSLVGMETKGVNIFAPFIFV